MDLYVGKTNTLLSVDDVVSCINNDFSVNSYLSTGQPIAVTSNIASSTITGGTTSAYMVRNILSTTDSVNIVAIDWALMHIDYSGFTLQVTVGNNI